jgi:DNA-binding IclR family transcriptional regulator
MGKPKSNYTIQTVSNALRLLEAFCEEAELGVSELSRRLGLHKNNVFRLLATLELGGYVEQSSDTDCYRLGVRCVELGRSYARSHSLVERARPVLEDLVAELGETAHLGVLRDFEVVHLDGIQPQRMLVTASRVGQRLPVHCSALGKVLIACSQPGVQESYDRDVVCGAPLEALTAATLVDRVKLFDQLRSVAGQGYALDLGECEDGLHCAAAPVYGENNQLLAALSVSGPGFRVSEDELHASVLSVLSAAASRLSSALGSQG